MADETHQKSGAVVPAADASLAAQKAPGTELVPSRAQTVETSSQAATGDEGKRRFRGLRHRGKGLGALATEKVVDALNAGDQGTTDAALDILASTVTQTLSTLVERGLDPEIAKKLAIGVNEEVLKALTEGSVNLPTTRNAAGRLLTGATGHALEQQAKEQRGGGAPSSR